MNRRWLLIVVLLALGYALYTIRGPKAKPPNLEAASEQPANRASVAATATPNQRSPSNSASTPPAPSPSTSRDLESILEKYSGTRNWTLDREADGYVFKITGANIKGVLKTPEAARAFLGDLTRGLGFDTEPMLRRDEKSADRLHIVDYFQMQMDLKDDPIPVFDSWIRLMGNPDGDVFLISNQLKPVDPNIILSSRLSNSEALALAKAYVNNEKAVLALLPPNMVFANARPHQVVTQVTVTGILPHKLLLIGHDSRTVVFEKIMSRH